MQNLMIPIHRKVPFNCTSWKRTRSTEKTYFRYAQSCFPLLLCIMLAGLYGCRKCDKNVVKNGVHFDKLCYSKLITGKYKGAIVIECDLADDTIIQGYPCKKGFVSFNSDWSLSELTLSQSFEFNHFTMPAETYIVFGRTKHIQSCNFPRDVKVQGHLCRGGRGGPEGVVTSFYENGYLKSFFSRNDIEIDGILCKGSLFNIIGLHDNGRLSQCNLAKTTTIDGTEYNEKSKINLDREGNVIISN